MKRALFALLLILTACMPASITDTPVLQPAAFISPESALQVAELARWSSKGAAFRVAFSPNGRMLALGSSDGIVQLWGADSSQLLRTLEGHTWYVTSVAFSPDGQMLASASSDSTVRMWDAASGQHIRTLEGHSAPVLSVAFSPDGRLLASGSADGTARLWGVAAMTH